MMLRDMTVLSRDHNACTGVFRLDGHRKPYYFVAVRVPTGAFRVQRVYPQAPADASAAVSKALNMTGDADNPPKRSRGGVADRVSGLPRRAAHLGGKLSSRLCLPQSTRAVV